jgi:hypothetical protein
MGVEEIQRFLQHVRVAFDTESMLLLFLDKSSTITIPEFWRQILKYFVKEEVRPLFEMYAKEPVIDDFAGGMTIEEFGDFLNVE